MTFPPSIESKGRLLLQCAAKAESDLTDLMCVELDSMGFLIAPNETKTQYHNRLKKLNDELNHFDQQMQNEGQVTLCEGFTLHAKDRILPDLFESAQNQTALRYGFSVDWVPAFYPEKTMGLLWAGCTIMFDDYAFPIFTIRRAYEKKETFLKIYGRNELIAHESCHVARAPLDDIPFEEHFAYALSASALRRTLGNAFQSDWDALLFMGPLLLVSALQIALTFLYPSILANAWVWWGMLGATLILPACMTLRSVRSAKLFNKAVRQLKNQGVSMPESLLFRCTSPEILQIAHAKDVKQTLQEMSTQDSFRFQIAFQRFIS